MAHLLKIHPDGIIQDINPLGLPRTLFLLKLLFELALVGGFDDFDVHAPQENENTFKLVRADYALRQGLIDLIVCEVVLLLGVFDQFFDLYVALLPVDFEPHGV